MNGERQAYQDRRMLEQWDELWLDPDWDRVLGYRSYPGESTKQQEKDSQ